MMYRGSDEYLDGQLGRPCWLAAAMIALVSTATPILTSAQTLASATLPSSRSGEVGTPLTAFVTIVNGDGSANAVVATQCGIGLKTALPADFSYQTTDATTNALIGEPNTPVDIAPGGSQTFVITITPQSIIDPIDVQFDFDCANREPALVVPGINTLTLSASNVPVPDVIAFAQTAADNGVLELYPQDDDRPCSSDDRGRDMLCSIGTVSVVALNTAAADDISVSIHTGATATGLEAAFCEAESTGACIGSPTRGAVVTRMERSTTAAFNVFVRSTGELPFDPVANRVFLKFTDSNGTIRGSTSVAVSNPAFGWTARQVVAEGAFSALRVEGQVWSSTPCEVAELMPALNQSDNPQRLVLNLFFVDTTGPDETCSEALTLQSPGFNHPNYEGGYTEVVIKYGSSTEVTIPIRTAS